MFLVPLATTLAHASPKHDQSSPVLTVREVFFSFKSAPFFRQTYLCSLWPKSSQDLHKARLDVPLQTSGAEFCGEDTG